MAQVNDRAFEALKNLADITGELSALGWDSLADRIADQIDPLAELSGHSVEDVFGLTDTKAA